MTSPQELQLINRILAGDKELFGKLVEENQKVVYGLALKLMGNEQDALDISQDVFLKAYLNLRSFRGESKFSVWLYRLTYNACMDAKRKNKHSSANVPLTLEDDEGTTMELPVTDSSSDPQKIAERKELHKALQDAVNSLPEEFKSIVILRESAGLSYSEIAEILKLSEGTVKSRLSRGRKQIAKFLLDSGTYSIPSASNKQRG